MPQFDFSTFPSQIFWLAVTFVTLYFLLSMLVMPKVGAILTERQEKIEGDLAKAEELKVKTEEAIAAYEKALADARAQAQAEIKKAHDEISTLAEARNKEISEALAAKIKAGEEKIAQAKADAMASVKDIAVEVAKDASAKIAGLDLADQDIADAVGAQMKEGA